MLSDAGLKNVIDAYFLEYSALASVDQTPDHLQHSPVMEVGATQHSIVVEDDCPIYTVVLGVVLNGTFNGSSLICTNLMYSRPKLLWPSARHTNVNVFSNRAEFLWPPGCK